MYPKKREKIEDYFWELCFGISRTRAKPNYNK